MEGHFLHSEIDCLRGLAVCDGLTWVALVFFGVAAKGYSCSGAETELCCEISWSSLTTWTHLLLCPFSTITLLPLSLLRLCILTLPPFLLCPTFLFLYSLQSLLLLSNITQSPPIPIQRTLALSLPHPLSLPPSLFLSFISPPASRSTLLLFAQPACSRPLSLSLSLSLYTSHSCLLSVFLPLSVSFCPRLLFGRQKLAGSPALPSSTEDSEALGTKTLSLEVSVYSVCVCVSWSFTCIKHCFGRQTGWLVKRRETRGQKDVVVEDSCSAVAWQESEKTQKRQKAPGEDDDSVSEGEKWKKSTEKEGQFWCSQSIVTAASKKRQKKKKSQTEFKEMERAAKMETRTWEKTNGKHEKLSGGSSRQKVSEIF